ncbi:MAG: c-type cytochrome [Bacteroidetes bacterium]|nr:c-type cytochrome [Bacteroidota bacterium]MCL5026516.1 c-type cytochrome [Chloroflexota bacterium]
MNGRSGRGRSGHILGISLVSLGIVAGLVLAGALYVWDTQTRASAAKALAGEAAAPASAASSPASKPAGSPTSAPASAGAPTSAPTAVSAPTPAPITPSAPTSAPAKPTAASTAASSTPAPAATGGTANAQAGQAVFQKFCQGCHPGGNKGFGPALKGPDFQQKFPGDDALAALIRKGEGSMPAFSPAQIDDAALADLIAYIRSLK